MKLKISKVDVIPLGAIEKTRGIVRSWALIRIKTSDGTVGWGESSTSYGNIYPLVTKQIVDSAFAKFLMGQNPLEVEGIVAGLRESVSKNLGLCGPPIQTISGIEIALWDILGKSQGKSISELIGGSRAEIPVYLGGKTAFDKDANWHYNYFGDVFDSGFDAVKLRIGKNPKWDINFVKKFREKVGEKMEIMVDAFLSYGLAESLEVAQGIAKYDVEYFEEPIPQQRVEDISRLVNYSSIPIAYGEHFTSPHEFRNFINQTKIGVLQPDATINGGISECLNIGEMAKKMNLDVYPHLGGLTAVGIAANVHLSSAIQKFKRMEWGGGPNKPLRDGILRDPIFEMGRFVNGKLRVPDGPGLGVEINEKSLINFRYESVEKRQKEETPPNWYKKYYGHSSKSSSKK